MKISIIGAGFSGLTAAFYLDRAGYQVEIFESSQRTGGLLRTLETPHGLVELAANGLLNSPLVEELFEALDLPLIGTETSARKRFIFRDGAFRRWPLGFLASLRTGWFFLRYLLARKSVAPRSDESVSSWSRRVFGQEAGDYLIEPALQGIYAGDVTRMSAKLIFARFFAGKRSTKNGRQLKGPRGSVSAPRGMGQLISALELYLRKRGVEFHLGHPALPLNASSRSNPFIIATNPSAAALLLVEAAPELARLLKSVELSPVATTTAFFKSTDPRSKGFGVLFPRLSGRRMLGVLKNNFIFAGRASDLFSETWIMGGALKKNEIADGLKNDESLVSVICEERSLVFGLSEKPASSYVTRWAEGIPHYTLELSQAIPLLDGVRGNILLHGNYLGDLGLAKILERSQRLPALIASEGHWL